MFAPRPWSSAATAEKVTMAHLADLLGVKDPREIVPAATLAPLEAQMRTPDERVAAPPADTVEYLARFGYDAADLATWRTAPGTPGLALETPRLEIAVTGHRHTSVYYVLVCALSLGQQRKQWEVLRQLRDLRGSLHDPVKELMRDSYQQHFGQTPFALPMGPPGTTARLDAWCKALATAVNWGACPPGVAQVLLSFFEAPALKDVPPAGAAGTAATAAKDAPAAAGPPRDVPASGETANESN